MATNTFVVPDDMSDLCRVCLQLPEESQYLDLTTIYDEEENLTYGECFMICTQIDLNAGEDVPHHLCKTCGLELQMSYDFYKKVEDSKRVIDQYQIQIKAQTESTSKLLPIIEQSQNSNLEIDKEGSIVQWTDDKYINIDDGEDEEQLPEPSEKQAFADSANVKDMSNMCEIEDEPLSRKIFPNIMQPMNEETDDKIGTERSLEMEDYQNLEILEYEETETETLQIKCGENVVTTLVTEFKIIEENEEFIEDAEYYNGEEEYVHEANEEEEHIDDQLTWQENVVTVANKEHLPIDIERCGDLNKKMKSSEIIENEDSGNKQLEETKSNTLENNNSSGRKRHVGSYTCNYCQRVYPNYSRMKTHRRCHEVNRPKFSCSLCDRVYATKQARDCHFQTAHDKSGYTCNICGKVFAIRKSLEIHVRYHTGDFPYECKLCDRKFAQACHLNTHINVKHNQIRFSCEYPNCGKCFTSSSSLRNHEYTHGVMPFACEYCHQGYPAKSKLRVHIKRKHGVETTNDQLENMRKFHIMRSKVKLVQFV